MGFRFNPFTGGQDSQIPSDQAIANKLITFTLVIPDNHVCFHRDIYFDEDGSVTIGENAELLIL